MKKNILLAVLLTALFLAPFSAARGETEPAFTVDETAALQGMDRSYIQGYTPGVNGNRWTMILPVRSELAAGNITAELVTPETCNTFFRTRQITCQAWEEENDVWGVRFNVPVFADVRNADYDCVIRVTGQDAQGNALNAEFPYTIRVRGNTENAEKVRMDITGVEGELSVGENGEIRIGLTNPCAAADFENIEIKVSDASGTILPSSAETLQAGDLAKGESMTAVYPVIVTEKAAVTPHVLKIDLSWTALGQQAAVSASYTVPVHQEIRLEQGGIRMPSVATAGDAVSVTLPLMNMGKADVVNVMATISVPGIAERQSVLVGTIQPGETKQAQLLLSTTRETAGDYSGTLRVECTDQDGNEASFELPVSLTVKAPEKTAAADGETKETKEEKTSPEVIGLAGGCGFLAILLLIQGILLRKKVHRLEEEKL